METIYRVIASMMLAVLVSIAAAADGAKVGEKREVIAVDAHAREELLAEMRAHVANIGALVDALSRNDLKSAAAAARASGMKSASEADARMMKQLPKQFAALGMSMHQDFDHLAAAADERADPNRILAQLSVTMRKCVACHAAYELRVR